MKQPNELDKKLTIQLDCINNPIQAADVGAVELNQNRVDKIIQFKTDYTSLGLKAGDLIDVTNTFKAAKEGTISKDDALKKYNDTLGATVGYAGSLEQAEQLLADNTAVVVEGIKLRTQANVFYAKSAEAAAKAISGEDVDPTIWESVGNYSLSGGNALIFQSNQIKTVITNYDELGKMRISSQKKVINLLMQQLRMIRN
jgi:hypothetical protein